MTKTPVVRKWLEKTHTFVEILVALATIGALYFSYRQYARYRIFEQDAVITIAPTLVPDKGKHLLYLNVDVQNVGNVEIDGLSCEVVVTPFAGASALESLPPQSRPKLDRPADANLFTIDKGEFSTFSFAFEVPDAVGVPPRDVTAVLIEVTYKSTEPANGDFLSWQRQTIVPVSAKSLEPHRPAPVGKIDSR